MKQILLPLFALTILSFPSAGHENAIPNTRRAEVTVTKTEMLWRDPVDISSRDLYYGPGGKDHEPRGGFTFVKEDLKGTSPKFEVRDQNGIKWKVKLGDEARPETAASRLVWAAGYFASEDYFVPDLKVQDMPPHLHRGQKLVAPDGSLPNARLKRYLKGEEKIGNWQWSDRALSGTRELNGLRVLMALIDNWDVNAENNAIYQEQRDGTTERIYMVSDLGSSFGTPGLVWPVSKARGNLPCYRHAPFITKVTADYVDFSTPARDSILFLATPREFFQRLRLRWIGKRIPRSDARWTAQLLARLSPDQIRDAFRAAGYSQQQLEGFTEVVLRRISELEKL